MLFNSLEFLVFLALVYGLFLAVPRRLRKWLLLAASWFFYGYWSLKFLGLMVVTTAVDWWIGLALDDPRQPRRRWLLVLSVVINLGLLGTFKYFNFFAGELHAFLTLLGVHLPLPVLESVLPVGMSFYVFQSMGYTIDVYRGALKATRDFSLFALFVSFFPQLVAGPIERAGNLLGQFAATPDPTSGQRSRGVQLILWGYFKKVVVADNLALVVQRCFDSPGTAGGFLVLVATYAFTLQIYCDFSGYTDIARGLARCFGIELMENFRFPYFATSPRDFWHRWHISLSTWLRDYLYIPLGGSRFGAARTGFNLMLTMLLCGLWHGANWTFVAWGGYHGLGLLAHRLFPPLRLGLLGKPLAWLGTFLFVGFGFLVFRAHSLAQAVGLLASAATFPSPGPGDFETLLRVVLLTLPVWGVEVLQRLTGDREILPRLWPPFQALATAGLLVAILLLGEPDGRPFIYFQF